MSRVVVHIDRLVVEGGTATAREIEAAVGKAIRRELLRPGAVAALTATGDRPRVDAGQVRGGPDPAPVGAAIGHALTGRKPR